MITKKYISLITLTISITFTNLALSDQPKSAILKVEKEVLDSITSDFNMTKLVTKINFGISESQEKALFDLTDGRVDFQNLYEIKIISDQSKKILSSIEEFKGFLYPEVPPPDLRDEVSADPELIDEWWIEALQVKPAWELATGKNVVVADCDAGYYTDEPDISSNLDLTYKRDLSDKDNPFEITDGNYVYHGTAVAAILSGVLDQIGTNGIAFDSTLVPLQNYNYSNVDDFDKEISTAKCILYALTIPDVKIIVLENQTWEGSSETFAGTRSAVKLALEMGITIVSAAGNYYRELSIEKEFDTGSIIVGALNRDGSKADFSNYGERITTAAFGRDLHTLYGPEGRMGEFGGTSGATPQVAATVALMLEVNPKLTPLQIKKILEETHTTTEENATVGGQLNVLNAVQAALREPVDMQAVDEMLRINSEATKILKSN